MTTLENESKAELIDALKAARTELSVINSVQETLAASQDFQSIYEAVGDKIIEIFGVQTVGIYAADLINNLMRFPYLSEREDKHTALSPVPINSFYQHIIDSGKTFVMNQEIADYVSQFSDYKIPYGELPKSTIAVPVIQRDDIWIGISLQDMDHENVFSESDVQFLETLATSMRAALENAYLFDQVQTRNHEITRALERETANKEILKVIAQSPTDIQPVFDVIAQNAAQLSGSEDVVIAIADDDKLRVVAHYGNIPMIPIGEGIQLNIESVAGRAILEGRSLQAIHNQPGHQSDYPEGDKVAEKYGYRVTCAVPLMREENAFGAISIRRTKPELLNKNQINLIESFASQAAIAVENVRLFNETQRLLKETEERNAELAVINSVQEGLASKLQIQDIYDLVGDKVSEVTGADGVLIATWDWETRQMKGEYFKDHGEKIYGFVRPFSQLHEELFPEVEKGETFVIQEGLEEVYREYNHQVAVGGIPKSTVTVPLKINGKINTLIQLFDTEKENAFSDGTIRLVKTLARTMGITLENASLFDEIQRLLKETEERNAELAVINSVQEGLASKLDLEGIYTLVGNKISEITGAGVVLIASWDWDSRTMRAEYFRDQGKLFDRLERPLSPLHDAVFPEIEEGKTIVWNEGIEERYRKFGHEVAAGQIPKTTVAVPLKIGGEISSSIMIQDTLREYAFSEATIRLVETLARSAGIALENAQLFDETTQRNAELAIVNSVSEAMSKNLDVDTVVKIVGDKVQQIFQADMVAIGFINEVKGVTEVPYSYALGEYFEEESFPLGEGLAGLMFKTRQPLLLNTEKELLELGSVKTAADQHTKEQIQSWLGVPIIIGEKLIGGVSVQSYQTYAFDDGDLRLLSTLAANMGAVIENARLFEETRRLLKETEERNAELAVINSVQSALAAELDLQGIYDAIGDKIREIFDAQTLMIGTLDNETRTATINFGYEKGERLYPEPIQFTGLIDHINKTGEKVVINKNMTERAKEFGMVTVAGEMAISGVWMPFKIGNQVRGIITLQNIDRENAFPESDVRLLETIANSMSVALENARLFNELQRSYREISDSLERQTATGDILHIIANSPGEIQPVLEAVAKHAANLCQADDVQIYRLEDNHLHQTAHYGPLPAFEDTEFLPLDRGLLTGRAVLERRTIHADAGELSEEEYPISVDLHKRLKHRSVIVTPLVRENESIGAIVVRRNEVRPFSDTQISLLKTFANQAAIAIENVRLFDETNRLLAESMQQAEELKTVNTVSQALSSELELDALINLVGTQIQKIFSADVAYVALLNKETGYIEFPFNFGEEADKIEFGEGLTSQVIKTGEPLLINQDEDWQKTEKRIGVVKSKSYLGVPITLGNEVIGVISVQSKKWANMYGEKDVRLLSTIAGNVGVAIQNANLFNEVERQKEYFEALISSAPVAIITIGLDGNVTSWSPAAENLFGYTEEEAIGANIDDLVSNHPDVREDAEKLTQQYIADIGKIQLKSQRTHKDGRLIDVAINAMPVHVEEGVSGYIAIYNDISELEKARRDAEEANQAKSAFLANMSHELRTPLNAIIGFTRIVKRKATDKLPDKQINNLDKVLVSAEHLLGLINTVLDISKIEAGRMDLHITNFDIKSLVDLVLVTSQPLVRQEKVNLISEVPEELPTVHSDLEKIKQILINLVSNAAKFTHEGEIKVSVNAVNDHLEIAVADTGIGISSDSIDRIFQEFQQADVSTTREYGGTGLGLSISRSLARLLGGDLYVTSELGVGSTFKLSLPFYYGQSTQDHEAKPVAESEDDNARLVLVIDDNEDAIYLIRESLEEAGYQVAIARNGEAGLQLARELNPFAITLDIMMPKKDGWQVLHDLKADPDTHDIPVIMISIVDKKALGYRLGASDYLVKPLKDEQIHQSLKKITRTNGNKPIKRMLVVDDDPNVADMVQQLLEDNDYKIESAQDGLIALEKIRENKPDAILLDLMMPRLDGFGLIEELNKDPDLKRIPVIVLTAKLLDENEKKALKESVGRVIHKQGLSSNILLAEIEKTLQNPNHKEIN